MFGLQASTTTPNFKIWCFSSLLAHLHELQERMDGGCQACVACAFTHWATLPPYFLRRGLSINQELAGLARTASQQAPEFSRFCLSSPDATGVHHCT